MPVEYMRKPPMASAAVHSFAVTISIVCLSFHCVIWHCFWFWLSGFIHCVISSLAIITMYIDRDL